MEASNCAARTHTHVCVLTNAHFHTNSCQSVKAKDADVRVEVRQRMKRLSEVKYSSKVPQPKHYNCSAVCMN